MLKVSKHSASQRQDAGPVVDLREPGHIPVANEPGTEFVWFSPSDELRTAEAVMTKNMEAMTSGSTP